MSVNNFIKIKIGMAVEKMVLESPIKFNQDCLPKINYCSYEIDRSFGSRDLPSVVVDETLLLNQVVSVTAPVDGNLGGTVENLRLIVKTIPSNSRHDEYQSFIYKTIAEIKSAGWTSYYSLSAPRVSGASFYKIISPNQIFGKPMLRDLWLDPDYEMSINQWMSVDKFYYWNFFRNGIYLTLKAWRRDSEDAPRERGTYLISLNFESESSNWRSVFDKDEDKKRWKELLPDLLKGYAQERRILEDRARAAGIEIDTEYQDPPIRALQRP